MVKDIDSEEFPYRFSYSEIDTLLNGDATDVESVVKDILAGIAKSMEMTVAELREQNNSIMEQWRKEKEASGVGDRHEAQ